MDTRHLIAYVLLAGIFIASALIYSAIGVQIAGHKIKKPGDFLYPTTQDFRNKFGTKNKPTAVLLAYYIGFVALCVFFGLKAQAMGSSLRAWVDKIMGVPGPEGAGPSPAASQTSVGSGGATAAKSATAAASAPGTSTESVKAEDPKAKMKKKKQQLKKKEEEKKQPHVLRSSVVDPQNQVIPSTSARRDDETPRAPRMSQIGRRSIIQGEPRLSLVKVMPVTAKEGKAVTFRTPTADIWEKRDSKVMMSQANPPEDGNLKKK